MVQKSIFCHKFHRVPPSILPKFISTDPQHLGSDEKNSQKSIFLQKKWIFRWSVTEIHQHGPTTFGVGRKKVAKSIFLQKNQNLRYFLQKFISTDPQHLGSDEKNSQKSIFLQKNFGSTPLFTEIHQHGPTKFGVGRKNSQKSIFLQKKFRLYSTCYRNSSDGQNAPKKATVTTILIKAVTCSFLPSNSIV